MKLTGNKQRISLGGLILAGILLASFNGYQLFAMEHMALTGYSPTIKALQQKLRQLEVALAGEAPAMQTAALTGLFDRYPKPHPAATAEDTKSPDLEAQQLAPQESALPDLQGIVQVWRPQTGMEWLAVIGGRHVRRGDQIGTYRVGRITGAGVVLHGRDKRFFVAAPRPRFSNDQGE